MRKELIDGMVEIALRGESISNEQALQLESFTHEELDYLFIGTNQIRDKFKGDDVKFFITHNDGSWILGSDVEVAFYLAGAHIDNGNLIF